MCGLVHEVQVKGLFVVPALVFEEGVFLGVYVVLVGSLLGVETGVGLGVDFYDFCYCYVFWE